MPEFAIVGQGLAGTAVAWALLRRGRSVRVVDSERGGASRVAAGLVTPVTGKRLAESGRWAELHPAAEAFYRAAEAETGATFFHPSPALRLFADEAERDHFRRREQALRDLVTPADAPGEWFDAPLGGFLMPPAARLDVPRYLQASREYFRTRGMYLAAEAGPDDTFGAETVVQCRGYTAGSELRFNAAKGEILTVRVPGLAESRVVHRGVWLAPLGGELFRVGATYSWHALDAVPTPAGRAEIERKLRAFLKLPFEVVGHDAAVRPVIDAGVPALGRHPRRPNVAYFNGLGSKGALLSPFFAGQLAAHLCDGRPVEPGVDVRARLGSG